MKYAAILLSRQPRRPCGRDAWVRQTIQAIDHIAALGMGVISSVGLQTWELITAVAALRHLRLSLVVPVESVDEAESFTRQIIRDFGFGEGKVTFAPVIVGSAREAQLGRDRAVIEHADVLVPVSIRSNGNMAEALQNAERAGRNVIRNFQIPHRGREKRMAYEVRPEQLSPRLRKSERDYLIHWTRGCNGPWPDESRIDYYRDIISSDAYPRSAPDTLVHILQSGRLIASARHMPDKVATVSFTGLSPVECLPLMRWRARYGEMSFEPYGIGVPRDLADRLGIKPVVYFDNPRRPPQDVALWQTQSSGMKSDWRQENEYRCRGDLDLSEVPSDQLRVYCHSMEDAARIGQSSGVTTISLCD